MASPKNPAVEWLEETWGALPLGIYIVRPMIELLDGISGEPVQ